MIDLDKKLKINHEDVYVFHVGYRTQIPWRVAVKDIGDWAYVNMCGLTTKVEAIEAMRQVKLAGEITKRYWLRRVK